MQSSLFPANFLREKPDFRPADQEPDLGLREDDAAAEVTI
jgi:hypothetical protein